MMSRRICITVRPTLLLSIEVAYGSEPPDNFEAGRDAENFYKRGIPNIFVLSYALTYKYELTLIVGASLQLARSVHPERM